MRTWKAWGCVVILGVLAWSVALGQTERAATPKAPGPAARKIAKPTTKPVKAEVGEGAEGKPNILVPVDKIKTLTDEQMGKLQEIAARLEKDKAALIQQARDESFALLTAEQMAELAAYKENSREAAAQRKLEAAKRREERQNAKAEKAKLKAEKKAKSQAEKSGGGTAQPE